MALTFSCRNCGSDIVVELIRPGEIATCRSCGTENVVPKDSETPFQNFKVRSLLLWAFVSLFISTIVNRLFLPDLTYVSFFWFHGLVIIWTLWNFNRSHVSLRRVIGGLPNDRRWLSAISVVIPTVFFALGSGLVAYIFVSLVSPSAARDFFSEEYSTIQKAIIVIAVLLPVIALIYPSVITLKVS